MLGENKFGRAIIVVDMVEDLDHKNGNAYMAVSKEIIPFVQGELQYFRDRMRPVIFCSTAENSKVIRELSPRAGDINIKKTRPNAFFNTELSNILDSLNIKIITIVGMPLHTSVLLTAAAAIDHGLSVVVPETCVCSIDEQDHVAALRLVNRWSREMSMQTKSL